MLQFSYYKNIGISADYPSDIMFFLFQKQCILPESKDVKRNEDIGKFQEQILQNKMPWRQIATLDSKDRKPHTYLDKVL